MTKNHESGARAYMAFKLSHAMFGRAPGELEAAERGKLTASVRRQVSIETCVLESAEATEVAVPPATLDDALGQIEARYDDHDSFEAAMQAHGFDRASLAEALARELHVDAVLDRVSSRMVRVSELDVQLHYQLQADKLSLPERRVLSQILITINPDFPENTEHRALARMRQIRARLLKKPDRFAEQALKHSECPSAMNGGRLGEYRRGQLFPEIEAALFALAPGELSEVVHSELGFHLIRCNAVMPAGVPPYQELAPRLRAAIEARRRRLCQREWLRQRMQAAADREQGGRPA
ncbi:MAG: nitrogen fixation protein NifM [Rhodocyclaceae bacterium]|nr:nitrogen fixation protein NifM [Rhodocyclaceae bacterium]